MRSLLFISLLIVFSSCKKNNLEPSTPAQYSNGLVVLNEGLFQQNNASLSFYSFSEQQVYQQVFLGENQRGLGDTSNDFVKYSLNGKDYIIIAVDVSSQLEIVEAASLKSVAQIPVFDGTTGRQPRFVRVKGSAAYSGNYDGTVSVVDLNSYSIIKTINVGNNPDGLAISGNYLYVGNSGGLNAPDYDSTVSVINLNTNLVETTIDARINMRRMLVDEEGDVYAISRGNYSDVEPAILRIDTASKTIVDEIELPLLDWAFSSNWIYYYDQDQNGIYRFNTLTESLEGTKLVDCSDHDLVYKVEVLNNLIYTADANGYVNSSTIRCYNLSGSLQYSFTAGLNTNAIILND